MIHTALRRGRRDVALGALLAGVVLAGTLAGCGSDPGGTTCGELTAMSVEERLQLLGDLVAEGGSAAEQQEFDEVSAAEKRSAAENLPAACDGAEDDTRIQDLDGGAA